MTRRPLLALLLVFLGLGLTYALVIPCCESPDEWSHLSVIRYWREHHTAPPRTIPDRRAASGSDVAWFFSYHDPPLYYAPPLYHALAALLVSPIGLDDLPHLMTPSPAWAAGFPPQADTSPFNKNIFVHTADETWATSPTVRSLWVLRLLSLGLGAVTVYSTYALAGLLWPGRPLLALVAAAVVASNPQFIALSVGVTNDNLLNALFGLALVWTVRLMGEEAPLRRWAALGGLTGLALLTKPSGLLLLPLGLLAALWADGSRREFTRRATAFLITATVVGGWWYLSNAIRYSDPLGIGPHLAAQRPLAHFGLREAWMIARSYWAAFGWGTLLVATPFYLAAGAVLLLALAGLVGRRLRPPDSVKPLVLLLFALLLNIASLVRWAIATGAPVGRLLFPTLPVLGLLVAWGLSRWGRRFPLVIVTAAFLFAAYVPWHYLRPAYTLSTPTRMPETAVPFERDFGPVRVVGYEPLPAQVHPGDTLVVTIYWQAARSSSPRYRVWVQLAPQDPTKKVAAYDFWLGGTLYPVELWQAGETVRETYRLTVPDWAPAPETYWIRFGLTAPDGHRLTSDGGDMLTLGPLTVQ